MNISQEEYQLLADENKAFAEFLEKHGATQEGISLIARGNYNVMSKIAKVIRTLSLRPNHYQIPHKLKRGATICIDIDNTILHGEPSHGFDRQKPIDNCIELVDKLCKRGFKVCYWTGRPKQYETETRNQLIRYGFRDLPIHFVYKGDILIDDKAVNAEDFEVFANILIDKFDEVCL